MGRRIRSKEMDFAIKDFGKALKNARVTRRKLAPPISVDSVAKSAKASKAVKPTKADILQYPGTVPGRKERLSVVSARLKEKFVGIDTVIDTVIGKITYWYLYPDRSSRPLIINLWGMTGVGKTDLVRTLKDLLGFSAQYVEIAMNNRSDSDTIGSAVEHGCQRLARSEPGIIVTDEFQRFRTKSSDGEPLKDLSYTDLWQILSDGKIEDRLRYSAIYRLMGIMKWNPDTGFHTGKPTQHAYDRHSDELVIEGSGASGVIEALIGYPLGDGKDPLKVGLPRDVDALVSAGQNLRALDRYLSRSGKPSGGTVDGILNGTYECMLGDLAAEHLASCDDYTKALIFVIGNLDDLYSERVGGLSSPFVPADFVREKSYGITVPAVKEALADMFFPEQVARLGNIHITYPALGSQHYTTIASRAMQSHIEGLQKWYPNIYVGSSVLDLIVANGVYPTQGTRPVLTTVSDIMSEVATMVTSKYPEGTDISIAVEYRRQDSSLVLLYGESVLSTLPYVGDKDRIINAVKGSDVLLKAIAIHECGHAVALYALSSQVVDNIIIMDNHAFNMHFSDFDETFEVQIALITMYLSGYAAVREFLGVGYLTDAHSNDFKCATDLVVGILRRQGMGHDLAKAFGIRNIPSALPLRSTYTTQADSHATRSSLVLHDTSIEALFVDTVMTAAMAKATELVHKHKKSILALAGELSSKLFLSGAEIGESLKKTGIKPVKVSFVRRVTFSEKAAMTAQSED